MAIEETYRAPSVEEAVAFLMQPSSLEYRRCCLAFWREQIGESFAGKVERELRWKWSKRERAA